VPDVFEVLSADHRQLQRLLSELDVGPDRATDLPDPEQHIRARLSATLISEAARHEAVEHQYFWPAVRDRLRDGDELSAHATAHEAAAVEALARLDQLSPGDPDFENLLAKLTPATVEHIGFEEDHVWPLLHVALSAADAEQLGEMLIDGKKTAPTRPYPRAPFS
jgi:Hemerythrin HHE cation binding domain